MRVTQFVIAGLIIFASISNTASAQKPGGTLRVYHRDSPASMSIHEEATFSTVIPIMLVRAGPAAETSRSGGRLLLPLGGLALGLVVLELALGAQSFGVPALANPCTSRPGPAGGGLDGTVQRFARSTLDGAACQLHTTREELVLSFVPAAGTRRIRWTKQTIDRALRAGLARAAHNLAGNGIVGSALAFTLSQIFAPSVEWFLQTGG